VTYDKERYANDPDYREKLKAPVRRWREANRLKINAQQREQYAANPRPPEEARRSWLWNTYGITPETYEAMVARQKGRCALCRRRPIERLCVDHSHDTRKLRLLLCIPCNTGLGGCGDDPDLLRRSADYLEILQIIHSWPGPSSVKPIPNRTSSKRTPDKRTSKPKNSKPKDSKPKNSRSGA
jgi:recombination endonuclease VII